MTKGVDQRGDQCLAGFDLELLGFDGLDRVPDKGFCPAIGLRLPDQRLEGFAPECLMRLRELFPGSFGFQPLHAHLIQLQGHAQRAQDLDTAVAKGTVVQHPGKRTGFACCVDVQNLAALLIADNTALVALVAD